MPLTWQELAKADPLNFRIASVPPLLAKRGDRWEKALDKKQDLEEILRLRVIPD